MALFIANVYLQASICVTLYAASVAYFLRIYSRINEAGGRNIELVVDTDGRDLIQKL
jgi:hypothetical protein